MMINTSENGRVLQRLIAQKLGFTVSAVLARERHGRYRYLINYPEAELLVYSDSRKTGVADTYDEAMLEGWELAPDWHRAIGDVWMLNYMHPINIKLDNFAHLPPKEAAFRISEKWCIQYGLIDYE